MANVLLVSYVLTVYLANWSIVTFGMVPVGLGLLAPAGVYFAGLSFSLRDAVQQSSGKRAAGAAVLVGAGLSAFLSPQFALASGGAFLVSELLDLLVFTRLRAKGLVKAVVLSNIVGTALDSAIFLWLAFGSLAFIEGNIVGKLWTTALAVLAITGWRTYARLSRGTNLQPI
jgi:queuosine precursor transporter